MSDAFQLKAKRLRYHYACSRRRWRLRVPNVSQTELERRDALIWFREDTQKALTGLRHISKLNFAALSG